MDNILMYNRTGDHVYMVGNRNINFWNTNFIANALKDNFERVITGDHLAVFIGILVAN